MSRLRSADLLVKTMLSDPQGPAKLQNDPEGALKEAAETAKALTPLPDTWVYRMVVGALGLVVLVVVTGYIAHTMGGGEPAIPDGVIAIGSAALGALAGLLAPQP